MKGSFRIATIAGSEVRIHFSFLLLLGYWAVLGYYYEGGLQGSIDTLIFGLLVFLCVLLHEFGHALTARYFGIRTPDITLLPIGGVARLERIPSSPFQEFVITVAGPAVNVVIALGLLPFVGGFPSLQQLLFASQPPQDLLAGLLWVNLFLVKFNLIPAFPMDGGRIFRSLLASQMNYAKATRIAARVGQGIAGIFVLAGFIPWAGGQQFMLLFIGVFIFIGAQQELAYAQIREAIAGHQVSEAMITRFETLGDTMRMGDIPDLLLGNSQKIFPVVGDDLHYHGLVGRDELLKAAREHSPETLVTELVRKVEPVTPSTSSTETLELMQRISEPVLAVVNASGQIIGLVDLAGMIQGGADSKRL